MARRVRRTQDQIAGATEARRLAATLGQHCRAARRAARLTLEQLARQVGISVARLSEIERGLGASAPLGTWIALGVALGRPLAVAFSRPMDERAQRTGPADAGHLEIQEHLLRLARATGREGTFELPTRPLDPSARRTSGSAIRDAASGSWRSAGTASATSGRSSRATNRKTAEAAAAWPDDRIASVWIVRATAANRRLLARFPHIIDATFPGSSRAWVRALTDGAPPPHQPGLVWFDPSTDRLTERRRVTMPREPIRRPP